MHGLVECTAQGSSQQHNGVVANDFQHKNCPWLGPRALNQRATRLADTTGYGYFTLSRQDCTYPDKTRLYSTQSLRQSISGFTNPRISHSKYPITQSQNISIRSTYRTTQSWESVHPDDQPTRCPTSHGQAVRYRSTMWHWASLAESYPVISDSGFTDRQNRTDSVQDNTLYLYPCYAIFIRCDKS